MNILYNKGNDIFEFTNSEITKLDIKVIDKMVQKSIQELKDELINSKNISKAQRIVEKAITTTSYCDKGHEYIDKIEGGKDNTTCAILKRK